jgi:hypothetical protein
MPAVMVEKCRRLGRLGTGGDAFGGDLPSTLLLQWK